MGRSVLAFVTAFVAAFALAVAIPGVAQAETILRISTVSPEGSLYMNDLRSLSRDIERLSGGELRVRWFSGGRLGDDRQTVDLLAGTDGRLDGGALTGVGLMHIVPEMRIFLMPGMFRDYDEVDYVRHKFHDEIARRFEAKGYVLLISSDTGFTHIFSADDVDSYAHLAQHPFWNWSDDDMAARFAELLGLNAFVGSLGDLADGLRKGKISAWIFPPLAVVGFGFQPYAKSMLDLRWNFVIGGLVLRKDVFDALPEDQRRLLVSVGRKWEPKVMRPWSIENEKAIAAMKKQGLKVIHVEDSDLQAFNRDTAAHRVTVAKQFKIDPFLDDVEKALDEYRNLRRGAH